MSIRSDLQSLVDAMREFFQSIGDPVDPSGMYEALKKFEQQASAILDDNDELKAFIAIANVSRQGGKTAALVEALKEAGITTVEIPAPSKSASVVHASSTHGSGLTRCCESSPFDLPRTDRLTLDPELVTCGIANASAPAEDLVKAAARAIVVAATEASGATLGVSDSDIELVKPVARAALSVIPSRTKVQAVAWDQGYWAGINGHTGPGNPYREPNAARLRDNEAAS